MFQNTVQNTFIIKILEYFVEKNQRNTCISSSTIFFNELCHLCSGFLNQVCPRGRVKSKPTRANKSHVRLLAIDWLEKANKKHTSKT